MDLVLENPTEFCKKINLKEFEKEHLQDYYLDTRSTIDLKIKLMTKYTKLDEDILRDIIVD
jgi:hypothetical protein